MTEPSTDAAADTSISVGIAFLAAIIATVACLAFAYGWEAIAQAMGDF